MTENVVKLDQDDQTVPSIGSKRMADGDVDDRPSQKPKTGRSDETANGMEHMQSNGTAAGKISKNQQASLDASHASERHTPQENDEPEQSTGDGATRDDPSKTGQAKTANRAPAIDGMSKNQQKKLRKQAEYEAKREDRKVIRKEKMVAKRERKREEKQQQATDEKGNPTPAPPKSKIQKAKQLPVTFLIDCDFDDLMADSERVSLGGQITRCYSENKNSRLRAHLTLCSFGGKLKERFDTVLTQNHKNWHGVRFLEGDFVSAAAEAQSWMRDSKHGGVMAGAFAPHKNSNSEPEQDPTVQAEEQPAAPPDGDPPEGETVYLTSEGDETLTELKPYSTYIIGGLVDKNREKGICYKRARAAGVRTAKLPIGEFLQMASRKVLATNHVNEIMLRWLECRNWGEAFMAVIPKRKGGQLIDDEKRGAGGVEEAGEGGEEGDDNDGETEGQNDGHVGAMHKEERDEAESDAMKKVAQKGGH